MGLSTTLTIKKIEFPKCKKTDSRQFKKPLNRHNYFSNRSTDFDEIWQGDADWPPTGERPLKFRIFQKPRWRRPPS